MRREDAKRVTTTLTPDEYERLKYFAEKYEMSMNDYIKEAILFYNRWKLGDVDLPTLEVQRLNQLIDGMEALTHNIHSLEQVTVSGFETLVGLTRGDNYLLEQDVDS